MPAESSDDRASFFDADDFAVGATYTPDGGSAVSVVGIFDVPHQPVDTGGDVVVSSSAPVFRCQTTDLPVGAAAGDAITIDSVNYIVADLQADGTGTTILDLDRA